MPWGCYRVNQPLGVDEEDWLGKDSGLGRQCTRPQVFNFWISLMDCLDPLGKRGTKNNAEIMKYLGEETRNIPLLTTKKYT